MLEKLTIAFGNILLILSVFVLTVSAQTADKNNIGNTTENSTAAGTESSAKDRASFKAA